MNGKAARDSPNDALNDLKTRGADHATIEGSKISTQTKKITGTGSLPAKDRIKRLNEKQSDRLRWRGNEPMSQRQAQRSAIWTCSKKKVARSSVARKNQGTEGGRE